MKKLFTIDDIMVAFVAAMACGFTDSLSRLLGWPELVCMALCLVIGIVSERIISGIIFSEAVQRKTVNRVIAYTACVLLFLAVHFISLVWMGKSLFDYLGQRFVEVIGLPILGFFLNLLIRALRIRKIRRLYGDGSRGYVFDLKQKDIDETNRQNEQISGEYDTGLAVKVKTGVYVGEPYWNTVCYLGIPYAQPPVGERRWKAPEPLPASDAVYEAKYFGASAVQVEHEGSIIKHHRQSEDCLTLNVFTAKKKADAGKPVLVLFHPGDFSCGGSVDPLLFGGNFAAAHPDTVFVSFNYRLGIFGFIDFSQVPGGEARPDTLNLGLLDQAAALRWIRENIAAFGGDPERITVLGFGAGATSILLLSAGGQAEGLFRKAFIFNGSPASAYDTPEASRTLAGSLLKETGTSSMAELLRLDTESLKAAAQKLWQTPCAPTCGAGRIPADVYRACGEGAASGVEFIVGFPGNETQAFRSLVGEKKYRDMISAAAADLQQTMGSPLAGAKPEPAGEPAASPAGSDTDSKLVEQGLALCIYRTAVKLAEGGSPVRMLYWGEKPLLENLGSGSVDAAAVLLGNEDALQLYGGVMNADLSETLQALLVKFMNGKEPELYPNEIRGVDAVDWKAFPKALIVSEGKLQCDLIDDRIIDLKSLLSLAVS